MASSHATIVDSPHRAPGNQPRVAAVGEAAHDPQVVAELKQEINALVAEVAQLAASDISPDEFYRGFLDRVVAAMAAAGGAIWMRGEGGIVRSPYQINLSQAGIEATPHSGARHALLLRQILKDGQAMLVLPHSGPASDTAPGNPTELLLVLAPLVVERETLGVVEIFQRPGAAPSTQRGYLRFVAQMAELAGGYLKSRRLRQLEQNQSLWQQLETLVQALHRTLDVRQTSYTIVNEGRRMIGCDRVSLAICCGNRCQIEAVSGLDSVDRRAAEVQGLARLAAAVIQTGEPLWSTGDDQPLPPQIEAPLQEYVDRSHARLIAVLPLVVPQARLTSNAVEGLSSDEQREQSARQPPLGALIIEQLRAAEATETLRLRAAIVAQNSASALTNAIEHSSVLLLPLWKSLGQAAQAFRGRTLARTLILLTALVGSVAALVLVPAEFEVRARGKLQPAERREIFAPLDGVITRLPIEHGQIVEAGAVLAELTNTDLDLQLAALLGRQTTNQERLTALERALLDNKGGPGRLPPVEENRLAGERLQLKQEAQSIERELKLVRDKQRQQTIVAPQRGQVVTWKVRDLLLHRPVSRGQTLLTLANADGPWELELYLPERRLAHIRRTTAGASRYAQHSTAGAPSSPAGPPDVHFVLSSYPGQTFHGRIAEIEQTAEVREEEGNTVLVRVTVDKESLPPLHDQTTVTAKLSCGRTSIGYAWFCDLIETVQSKVLFWLPG